MLRPFRAVEKWDLGRPQRAVNRDCLEGPLEGQFRESGVVPAPGNH